MEETTNHYFTPENVVPHELKTRLFETLAVIERDLARMQEGLALVGLKPCSMCKKFFRISEPGAFFDCGRLICFGCIPEWWSSQSARLSANDREKTEGQLAHWLCKYHHAQVVNETEKLPPASSEELTIVTHCLECHGSGNLLEGERCRFCKGRGTVWIVLPLANGSASVSGAGI